MATDVFGTSGVRFEKLPDGSYIPRGDNPTTVAYYFSAQTDLKGITGVRLELLTDPTLPRTGPGRATPGTAWLSEFVIEAGPASQPDRLQPVGIAAASADFETPDRPIRLAYDGVEKTSWGIDAGPGLRNQDRRAVFALASSRSKGDGGTLTQIRSASEGVWRQRWRAIRGAQHRSLPDLGDDGAGSAGRSSAAGGAVDSRDPGRAAVGRATPGDLSCLPY
jgi:hypothetical protein